MKTEIQRAIDGERVYGDGRWGTIEEHPHSIPGWILILERELAEAKDAWLDGTENEALQEILQVISVGVACLEQHGVPEEDDTEWSE